MANKDHIFKKCANLKRQVESEMSYVPYYVPYNRIIPRPKGPAFVDYGFDKYVMASMRTAIQKSYRIIKLLDKAGIPLETFLTYYELQKK
jgi:hypothetical protein